MTTRLLILLSVAAMLFLAGCGSGGGGGTEKPTLPQIPSTSVGQFDILTQLPYGDASLPEDMLSNVADNYTAASTAFATWALVFSKSADYAALAGESVEPFVALKNHFVNLALASHRLALALKALDSSTGESMAESLATAMRELADTLREDGLSSVADKLNESADQADALAASIGEGLSSEEEIINVLAADLAFRQSLLALPDEINVQGAGSMAGSERAVLSVLYYYIVTIKYQEITSTPVSATPWGQISPWCYRRIVTVNRTTTTVEAETSYATLFNAIWNINGFNYHELSRTVSTQQQTYTEYYFSFSTPPSDALPPASTRTVILYRRIRSENTTGAIGGG